MITPNAQAPAIRRSVLIVDDDLAQSEMVRSACEPRFSVRTAASGEQALEALRREPVDVVVLDLLMPNTGGVETYTKIREISPDVEIIMVSTAENESLAGILRRNGVSFIAKTNDRAKLVQAFDDAAERSQLSRQRARRSSSPSAQAVFSHDIKNRLNVVLGFVSLLRDGELDATHAARALDAIESSAHSAVGLTLNFLHAEESSGGALRLRKTSASLNSIVEQVVHDEQPNARLKRIDLQADLDPAVPMIDLDIPMISSAVTNLVNNAIQFSPEAGIVLVATHRFETDVILRVRDHGPGIAADELPDVFELYWRGANGASRTSTGFGLYVVRKIVEAHRGSVSVTAPPDGGSAFVIVLHAPAGARDPEQSSTLGFI